MALLNIGGKTQVVAEPSPGQNVDVRTLTLKSRSKGYTGFAMSVRGTWSCAPAYLVFCLELFETLHHITRKAHVIKHSFQLLCERVSPKDLQISKRETCRPRNSRFHFELGNHVPLGVFRDAASIKQSLRQMTFVVSLEDVLVNDEPEEKDSLLQDSLNLVVRFLRELRQLKSLLGVIGSDLRP